MKRAFVIGHPIGHSRSPLIHRSWLADLGIAGSYDAIDVEEAALPAFFDRLRTGEFAGGNVTIPHKQAVVTLCDVVEPLATRIGAVNTLVVDNGKVTGSNTDYLGFLGNLDQRAPGWDRGLTDAIVLGAGGAARAVLVALAERGVPAIQILNRTAATANALAAELPGPFTAHSLDAFASLAPRAGLVVNTTSVGMHGSSFPDLPLNLLPPGAIVTDIVYVPLRTPLLLAAEALGLTTIDGLGMLLHQAVPGFTAWFGVQPNVTPALRTLIEATL
ncbi:MAG: shikimate dehydrogenase [Devosia sp.]|nr:shikimate dehydrogenase [Devosia sp.]